MQQRRAVIASLGLCVLLVVHNLAWWVRNQVVLSCTQTVCASPHDLGPLADASPYPEIAGRLAVLYWLEARIGGATLVLPPAQAPLSWELAHVARLRVEPAEAAAEAVAPPPGDPAGAETRRWLVRGGRRPVYRTIELHVETAATRYVWSEPDGAAGPIVIAPEAAR